MFFTASVASFAVKELLKHVRGGVKPSRPGVMTPRGTFQVGRNAFAAGDYTRALALFGRVAHTYPPAMTNLAMMHWRGLGTPSDIDKARRALEQAADLGDPKARQLLRQIPATSQDWEQPEPVVEAQPASPTGSFAWAVNVLGLTETQAGNRIFIDAAFRVATDLQNLDEVGTVATAQEITKARDTLLEKLA